MNIVYWASEIEFDIKSKEYHFKLSDDRKYRTIKSNHKINNDDLNRWLKEDSYIRREMIDLIEYYLLWTK
jgi:hypothetical protein